MNSDGAGGNKSISNLTELDHKINKNHPQIIKVNYYNLFGSRLPRKSNRITCSNPSSDNGGHGEGVCCTLAPISSPVAPRHASYTYHIDHDVAS